MPAITFNPSPPLSIEDATLVTGDGVMAQIKVAAWSPADASAPDLHAESSTLHRPGASGLCQPAPALTEMLGAGCRSVAPVCCLPLVRP